MPIELRTQRDGTLRDNWYGRYELGGKRYFLNLGIKVAGKPPSSSSLKEKGDEAFEESRREASKKLQTIVDEARSKDSAVHLVEKIYEMKTGEVLQSVPLGSLGEQWAGILRKREPGEQYLEDGKRRLKRFTDFVKHHNPRIEDLGQVSRTLAQDFMKLELARSAGSRSFNETLRVLRSCGKHLLPAGAINPFSSILARDKDTVPRQPYSPEELKRILVAAETDDFIRPILVVGICTAMRLGDCCLLNWTDVDFEGDFIHVKTLKTGVQVWIPIFPLLKRVLLDMQSQLSGPEGKASKAPEGYVFPAQAKMYLENRSGITYRVQKVLVQALTERKLDAGTLQLETPEVVRERGLAFIAGMQDSAKKERMGPVFSTYMDGKSMKAAAAVGRVSKGTVSYYLNAIERGINCKVVRGRADDRGLWVQARMYSLRVRRKGGRRAASVRDFQAFRVTWVTLALSAGAAIELVTKVTGHRTVQIVLDRYFQPGRENFRKALESAMPDLMTDGKVFSQTEQLAEIAARSSRETAWEDLKRMRRMLSV